MMPHRATSCALLVLPLCAALAAQTPERAQTEAQARRVNERMQALQREADALAAEARTVLGDLRTLEIEQQLQVERLMAAEAAVAQGQKAVETAAVRLERLEQDRVAQLPELQAQLVDIYKRGRTGYARLLFGGGTVRDFSRATRAVAALMRITEQRVAEHRRTLAELSAQRVLLEGELRALQVRAAEARRARAAAGRALAARAALIRQIDARRDLHARFAGELQLAYARLQQQLADLSAGRPVELVTVPIAPFRGSLEWPAPGRVAVRFAQPSGRMGDTAVRNGIEIAAPEGAAVQAVHPGTVTYAEPFTGFGNLVIVDHGSEIFTLYGYLASVTARPGAFVDTGAELGRVGAAPAGPAALYFEVRVDGRSVDPVQWLRPR